MSTLSVRLPESLHRRLSELAEREGISINQLINSAVAEKMSALMTADYLEKRAKRSSRKKFDSALSRVANINPDDVDRIDNQAIDRTQKS
jgi:predicted transcriptional regulator